MSFKSIERDVLGKFGLQPPVHSCNREQMKEDPEKPKGWEAAEILEALRDTTNPKRGSLDRNMLARKAAFLEIIKRGTERDFIQRYAVSAKARTPRKDSS